MIPIQGRAGSFTYGSVECAMAWKGGLGSRQQF